MSSVLRGPDPFALDESNRDEIALFLAKAALTAGPAVMEEYDRGCEVVSKADGSPVTSADRRAEAIICECLQSIAPRLPVCAEELVAAGRRLKSATVSYWSTRLTAHANSSPATANSPSISPWCARRRRSRARFMRRPWGNYGSAASAPSFATSSWARRCPQGDCGGKSRRGGPPSANGLRWRAVPIAIRRSKPF